MTKNEIISIIAERTGVNRADVRLFLDKFNEIVLQGLNDDQMVKIKGLGTFKMVSVKARKSVSVNGGETIEIPAHNKVTFTAEKIFADMVNEPLAHLEVVELSDSPVEDEDPAEEGSDEFVTPARMKKLSEDAVELKGLLADINGLPVNVEPEKEVTVEENTVEENVVEEVAVEESVVEEVAVEESVVEEVAVEESVVEESTVEENSVEESSLKEENDNQNGQVGEYEKVDDEHNYEESKKDETMTHGGKVGRIFLLVMLLLLVIVGAIYYVNFKQVADVPEKEAELVVERKDTVEVKRDTVEVKEDTVVMEEDKLPDGRLTIEQMRTMKIDYSRIKATETVRDGSRLTMIALRAYGCKEFWIHIYLANRDQVSNPGQITTGMVIKIPEIDGRLIDTTNPDCLQYAKELQNKYGK
ncbi:MAG: HU family DNA-binding protein [Paludibacteraceae bacterium]|nr:HU family DNA-binding protein [Paludibacteraceae bacterium]